MLERYQIPVMRAGRGGHEFVIYGDSCSGSAGRAPRVELQADQRRHPGAGRATRIHLFSRRRDHGLDSQSGRFARAMELFFRAVKWLGLTASLIPLYHTTGNHTVYDKMSESVFREVMAHLPSNGPPRPTRPCPIAVRRGDLLLIFVNTLHAGTGGEGTIETDWLERILEATWRRPPQAGTAGIIRSGPSMATRADYQRTIERENGRRFWEILARHGVVAYCLQSHPRFRCASA